MSLKLDKRIKSIDDIQTILRYDVSCIGCKGYFFDEFVDTQDLSQCRYGELVDIITDNHDLCFKVRDKNGNTIFFRFFLPEADLIPVEKKYRPFSLEEFLNIFHVGDLINFRCKDNGEVKHAMFIGYADRFSADNTDTDKNTDKIPGENDVMIGVYRYSLSYLFTDYELFFMNKWQPFGIIDEDKE